MANPNMEVKVRRPLHEMGPAELLGFVASICISAFITAVLISGGIYLVVFSAVRAFRNAMGW